MIYNKKMTGILPVIFFVYFFFLNAINDAQSMLTLTITAPAPAISELHPPVRSPIIIYPPLIDYIGYIYYIT